MHRFMIGAFLLGLVACAADGTGTSNPGGDTSGPDSGDPDGAGPGPAPAPTPAPPDTGTPPAHCTWRTFKIGATPWTGSSSIGLAVSNTGEQAVMFSAMLGNRRDLVVGRVSGESIQIQPYGLSLIVNSSTAVAGVFGPGGALHIAYSNEQDSTTTNGGVSYSSGPGSSVFIDGAGLFGSTGAPAIALGADGRLRIAYVVYNGGLDRRVAVATGSGSSFSIAPAIIDNRLVDTPTIAIDPNGRTHVVVEQFENPLLHAVETATGWSQPDLVMSDGGYSFTGSMAIAPNGLIHLVRTDSDEIIHVLGSTNTWQTARFTETNAQIDPQNHGFSATIDRNGRIFVVWIGPDAHHLFFTEFGKPTVEIPMVLTPGSSIQQLEIAPSPDGARVAYATASLPGNPTEIYTARCE